MFFFRKKIKKSTPEDEEKFRRAMEENDVGFKDKFAMAISAFLVIILPALLVLLALSGLAMLLFGLFG